MVGFNWGMWVREIAAPLDHPGLTAASNEPHPLVFQGSSPLPVEHRYPCSPVDAAGTSRLAPGWGQMSAMRTLASSQLCQGLAWSTWQLSAQFLCCFPQNPGQGGGSVGLTSLPSSKQLGSGWAARTQGTGSSSGSTSLRQASGWFYSDSLVWPQESPLSRFKTREPHLILICVSHPRSSHGIHMVLLDLPAVMTL